MKSLQSKNLDFVGAQKISTILPNIPIFPNINSIFQFSKQNNATQVDVEEIF